MPLITNMNFVCITVSCSTDNPCRHEAVCSDVSEAVSCNCTPYYTGDYCDGTCK